MDISKVHMPAGKPESSRTPRSAPPETDAGNSRVATDATGFADRIERSPVLAAKIESLKDQLGEIGFPDERVREVRQQLESQRARSREAFMDAALAMLHGPRA